MSTTHVNDLLNNFIELHSILEENPYIRDTTNKLHRIIEDTAANTQIIFVGKDHVGKSTIINALLGTNLFPTEPLEPTQVNLFIKYDENERLEVVFYDGVVATFSLDKLQMIISSNFEIAEIIREHIQYIQVFIQNDFLKQVTLVDTHSLEQHANETIYLSDLLLSRMDEIFWVIREDSPVTDDELKFLKRISSRYMKPHMIVNAIDHVEGPIETFITTEQERYGEYTESFHIISAKLATDARINNDAQLFIDSRFTPFLAHIQTLSNDHKRKESHISAQFSNWLVRLRKEMELITVREPYISALESIKVFNEEQKLEFSKEQRDIAIIKTYEDDYKNCAQLFKQVQTLYQLLQAIGHNLFLRDSNSEQFEEIATKYLESLRMYRKDLAAHEAIYHELKELTRSIGIRDGNTIFHFPAKVNKEIMKKSIDQLNKLRENLVRLDESIRYFEKQLVDQLNDLIDSLNQKGQNQLKRIIQQVDALNNQRKLEYQSIKSSIAKLNELNCLVEAQKYVCGPLNSAIQQCKGKIDDNIYQELMHTIDFIQAIEYDHPSLNSMKFEQLDAELTKPIYVSFEYDYPFIPLRLTKDDIISTVDKVPPFIELG